MVPLSGVNTSDKYCSKKIESRYKMTQVELGDNEQYIRPAKKEGQSKQCSVKKHRSVGKKPSFYPNTTH